MPITRVMISAVSIVLAVAGPIQAGERKPHIVFVLAEREYNAKETVPKFAKEELADRFELSFVISDDKKSIPGLEKLREADLAVFYIHRRDLPEEQLALIRKYLGSGKPLLALRTTSHAFETWKTFDREILGCHYQRHYGNKRNDNPTYVRIVPEEAGHPILEGIPTEEFTVPSWLYRSQPLTEGAKCLMTGRVGGSPVEPVAWTVESNGRRVFYTMMGHPEDFHLPAFRTLLINAIAWALDIPSIAWLSLEAENGAGPVPGTRLFVAPDTVDIASELVRGVDRFCDKQWAEVAVQRARLWQPKRDSSESFDKSVATNRERLTRILGVVDERSKAEGFEPMVHVGGPESISENERFRAVPVRWPVFRKVHGEGLLLEPKVDRPKGAVIVLPSAGMTPEMQAGIDSTLLPEHQYARRLAEIGFRVLAMTIIDRGTEYSKTCAGTLDTGLTHREFIHRPAFELGRHILGYEVQKVLAAVEILGKTRSSDESVPKIGLVGLGDGGLVGICASALCADIDGGCVANCFGALASAWKQPMDRNLFGIARVHGDYELYSLSYPRPLAPAGGLIDSAHIPPGGRAGPAGPRFLTSHVEDGGQVLTAFGARAHSEELLRAFDHWRKRTGRAGWHWDPQRAASLATSGIRYLPAPFDPCRQIEELLGGDEEPSKVPAANPPTGPDLSTTSQDPRMARQVAELIEDTQSLLEESPYTRAKFWAKAEPARKNRSVDQWIEATKWYRDYFRNEVIGHFDIPKPPANPRSRQILEEEKYTGYEVVLDVFEDVIAYGILLVPRGIKVGEHRPVVVCQHGLEGRPRDLADPRVVNKSYNQYGCRLAERGFIVFAPQNLYIFKDRFRVLQRKLHPLGKTLFSVIAAQHEQILAWLSTLPYVDDKRIAFYGLSYGGKTAMRVPALVEKYCLSICSADFNDWVWKNASTRSPYSYVNTGEYEIFEWDLGSTFNYAEMAGLICPRPFMVERGHYDGVAPDERVASEYAKVRLLYNDLKIADRTEIEFFDGPHAIHGVGTFAFLHKHLNWPSPEAPTPLND